MKTFRLSYKLRIIVVRNIVVCQSGLVLSNLFSTRGESDDSKKWKTIVLSACEDISFVL